MQTIVETRNLIKDYGEGDVVVHALRGVDLTLKTSDFVAMAGPSGSGKSTLLNIIGALDRPTSGTVVVDGKDLSTLSNTQLSHLRRDRIGFVFQSYNLIPVLTALENAEYVLMLQGLPPRKRASIFPSKSVLPMGSRVRASISKGGAFSTSESSRPPW